MTDFNKLAAGTLIAITLAALFWRSGAVSPAAALGAMMVMVVVVLTSGRLLLRAARATDFGAPAAWVAGVLASSVALLLLVHGLQVLASTALAIWAALLLALTFAARRLPPIGRTQRAELVALAFCAAATLFWSVDLAAVPRALQATGVLTTWTDVFGHGSVISQYGDPRAAGRQAILTADAPAYLYHYATYMLPASLAQPLDLPGFPLTTSVWIPLGFLTFCAGAWALGHSLGGPFGGLLALATVGLLPDAASYGLHNRMFGFYWQVLIVPSSAYALGICLLGFALLHRWSVTGSRHTLLAAVAVVLALGLVRIHLFLLMAPVCLTMVVLCAPALRGRRLIVLAALAAVFAVFVHAFYSLVPDSLFALFEFLDELHDRNQPVAYRSLYRGVLAFYGAGAALLVGLLLIPPAFLGAFLFLYPLSLVLLRRVRALRPFDLLPVVALVWYFLLMITAPIPPHNDAGEFTHRPFVLVYAVTAIWTAAALAQWAAARGGLGRRRVWLPLLVAAAVTVFACLRYTVGDARWAQTYAMAAGLPQAAAFIRAQWRPGDVTAAEGLHFRYVNVDLGSELASLSGVPVYLAVPFVQATRGSPQLRQTVRERFRALEEVARMRSAPAALERLRELGIRWYVVRDSWGDGPRWDPERRYAAFVKETMAVYSTR